MRNRQRSQVSDKQTPKSRSAYPFSAVVAQEEMKLALILTLIDPALGGVLIMGHRGTGKSTVVRALADLLPEISAVAGCPYRCDPTDQENLCFACRLVMTSGKKLRSEKSAVQVVELPLGATEDRVCGTIDIEQALKTGVRKFEPGLLARANRGFLYIDEVNLLEDHLVDLLLDVAATGINKVERESISVEHPARFVLIGSGNPEEGELRPQLIDRFGLFVEVSTEAGLDQRVEIIQRRQAFDGDPESFCRTYQPEQGQLRKNITRARKIFPKVTILPRLLRRIAEICAELKVDGHRGELSIARASRALAAFTGRRQVIESDVKRVTAMAVRHRLRRDALEDTIGTGRIEQTLEKVFGSGDVQQTAGRGESSARRKAEGTTRRSPSVRHDSESPGPSNVSPHGNAGADAATQPHTSKAEASLPPLNIDKKAGPLRSKLPSRFQSSRQNRVKRSVYNPERGRYSRAVSSKQTAIALDATLRGIAHSRLQLLSFRSAATSDFVFPEGSLRYKLFKRKQGRLFIFAIDLSGSMARQRLAQAKAAMLGLLRESYIQRDSVAVVGFRGTAADVLLPPSRSILRARRALDALAVGGGTPLSAGLAGSLQLAKRAGKKCPDITLLLFTDGQANVPLSPIAPDQLDREHRQLIIETELRQLGRALAEAGVKTVVLDTQNRFMSGVGAPRIAELLNARFHSLTPEYIWREYHKG